MFLVRVPIVQELMHKEMFLIITNCLSTTFFCFARSYEAFIHLNKSLSIILGNGRRFWQSFCTFGLNLMCSRSFDLSDSSGPTAQRLPEDRPGETNIHTVHFLFTAKIEQYIS